MEKIVLIPQTVEYALRVAVRLAMNSSARMTHQSLAEATRVPPRYLYKVLQALGRAGLVESRAGPGGGYHLTRPPHEIALLDVVRAVGAVERIRSCPLGLDRHRGQLCRLHQELDAAVAAVEQAFARVRLSELVANRPEPPLCSSKATTGCTNLSAGSDRRFSRGKPRA